MIKTVNKVYTDYYSDPGAVMEDDRWSQNLSDTIGTDDPEVFAAGTIKGRPAFEDGVLESIGLPAFKTWRHMGGTMVAKSDNWTAIIPGGFRDGATPNKMNPISFEIGEYSALMGLVHLIAIPNKRITNCVTVMEEDIPLITEGIQLLDTAFNLLVEGGSDEIGSVRWQLKQSGSIKMKDGRELGARITEADFTEDCRANFTELCKQGGTDFEDKLSSMKMEVTCHADTMASIRKLHLHGFSADYKTVAWEKMEEKARAEHNQPKNTPIEQVIYMANSGEAREMRLDALMLQRQPEPEPEPEPDDSMLERQVSSTPLVRQSSRPHSSSWGDDTNYYSGGI